MEKVIYALSLVEHLVKSGLSYTFKGGTSLLLILPESKRFSVDVDIITTDSQEKIENILKQICNEGVFLRYELDEYRSYKPGVPKAHYQFLCISDHFGDNFKAFLKNLTGACQYIFCIINNCDLGGRLYFKHRLRKIIIDGGTFGEVRRIIRLYDGAADK